MPNPNDLRRRPDGSIQLYEPCDTCGGDGTRLEDGHPLDRGCFTCDGTGYAWQDARLDAPPVDSLMIAVAILLHDYDGARRDLPSEFVNLYRSIEAGLA